MFVKISKITITRLRKPENHNINHELQWFGNSLGLFGLRDKDKSCFRVFIELLKSAKVSEGLSSDEIAFKLNLSRGTVVHHLNRLMEAGIVINRNNKYFMRVENLKELIKVLKNDLEKSFNDLEDMAKEIDGVLGL